MPKFICKFYISMICSWYFRANYISFCSFDRLLWNQGHTKNLRFWKYLLNCDFFIKPYFFSYELFLIFLVDVISNIWIFAFTYLFILDINTSCTFSASLFQIKNIQASQLQRWMSPSKVSVVIRKHSRAWLYCWMMQTENHNFIKILYTIPQMALNFSSLPLYFFCHSPLPSPSLVHYSLPVPVPCLSITLYSV